MFVKDICTTDVAVVTRGTPIADAARLMRERHVGSLVVVSEGEKHAKPIAMITDRDLAIAGLARGSQSSGDVFVGDLVEGQALVSIDAAADLKHALRSLERAGARRAPVIERGVIVGVLSIDDVLVALVDELSAIARLVRRQPVAERKRTGDDAPNARARRSRTRTGERGRDDAIDDADARNGADAGAVSLLGLEPLSDDEIREITATPIDETEEREGQLKVLAHETEVTLDEDPADADAMVSAFDQTLAVRSKSQRR